VFFGLLEEKASEGGADEEERREKVKKVSYQ